MKKISKVLIAFILIAGLAIGAYFILSGKDNSKLVHQNVYNLTYNIKNDEKNVVYEINASVEEMCSLITNHTMQLDEEQTNLKLYSELFDLYSVVGNHILENGSFIINNNINDYVTLATGNYDKMIELYNQAYTYLQDTYYKIQDKNLYVETVKSYIQNFYSLFKEIIPEFNGFYYNTCLAYAYGLQNTMQKNNFYKLRIAFYAETINQYYLSETEKPSLDAQALALKQKINNETAEKYFKNKAIYDELVLKVKNINVGEFALKIATGKESELLNSVETEAERKIAQNYITYVARG